jgi:hypothetical protein
LQQPELEEADLARCCQLSKTLLSPSRRALYATASISFVYSASQGPDDWVLEPTSRSLVACLGASKVLAESVKSVVFSSSLMADWEIGAKFSIDVWPNGAGDDEEPQLPAGWAEEYLVDPLQTINTLLHSLPKLVQLKIDGLAELDSIALPAGPLQHLTHLALPAVDLRFIAFLSELEVLSGALTEPSTTVTLPAASAPRLHCLDLSLWPANEVADNTFAPSFNWLTRNSHDSLSRLSVPVLPALQPSLSSFVSLSHLSIINVAPYHLFRRVNLPSLHKTLSSLSSCVSLKSLDLSAYFDSSLDPSYLDLPTLSLLPSSLVSVKFSAASVLPYTLFPFLNSTATLLPRLKRVGLHESGAYTGATNDWGEDDFERFTEVCQRKGLECLVE